MSQFWIGYVSAVLTYLATGFVFGLAVVFFNLAHFHAGGFRVRRMVRHVALVTVAWPAAVLDAYAIATEKERR